MLFVDFSDCDRSRLALWSVTTILIILVEVEFVLQGTSTMRDLAIRDEAVLYELG